MIDKFETTLYAFDFVSYQITRNSGATPSYFQSLAIEMFKSLSPEQQSSFLKRVETDVEFYKI